MLTNGVILDKKKCRLIDQINGLIGPLTSLAYSVVKLGLCYSIFILPIIDADESDSFFSALLVVIQSVSTDLEGHIGELYFKIPNVTGTFTEAVSWCEMNNNSTLIIANDSSTQMALSKFLNSSQPTSLMYIDVKLYKNEANTWFLLNGSKYLGKFKQA